MAEFWRPELQALPREDLRTLQEERLRAYATAVGFDLVIALVVTSLLRARLGLRTWRIVHWLAYLAWPVALLHGLLMGADAGASWNVIVVGACVLTVGAALTWRLQAPKTAPMGGLA